MQACQQFVVEHLLAARSRPDWQQLDHLADVLTSWSTTWNA